MNNIDYQPLCIGRGNLSPTGYLATVGVRSPDLMQNLRMNAFDFKGHGMNIPRIDYFASNSETELNNTVPGSVR
ncbi:MAG: hypothetical protein AAGD25_01240 [Cyanobacteria bacterium P01_F01_bin.150]